MKILHVIAGLQLGGAETVLVRLVTATRPQFAHVVVVLGHEGHFGPLLRASGVAVHALGLDGLRGVFGAMMRLIRIARRERPALVQTWMYHADLLGGLAARLAGVRQVLWCVRNSTPDSPEIRRSTRWVTRLGACLSGLIPTVILCNSNEASRSHIAFGYRAAKFRIIPNGYDLTRFRPDAALRAQVRASLGIAPTEILLGNVARWDPQKDHGNLLRAVRIVARGNPNTRLLLVGSGIDAQNGELMRLIDATGLKERTLLAGSRHDVPALMNALDLHVLSSRGDAFPNVVAEAMACGTPCVVTDVGDAAWIVGDTGWVAPPQDPAALAAAIEQALRVFRRQNRPAWGEKCRARIAENFALPRMTEAYGALWRELEPRENQG